MTNVDTFDVIRIGAGTLSKSTILGSSSYLITNFPVQSDNLSYPYWQAYIDQGMSNGNIIQALSGAGGLYGKLSFNLTLLKMTPDMLDYWFVNIMASQYVAPVTIYGYHQRYKFIAVNCYMTFDPINNGTQQTNTEWVNVSFPCNRGTIVGNAYSNAYSEAYS